MSIDGHVAARIVESGDHVVVDTAPPRGVLEALANRTDLTDVTVYAYGFPYADREALAALATTDGVDLAVSLVPPSMRPLVADGEVAYAPRTVYATAREPFWRRSAARRVALVGAASREDERFRLSCLTTFGRHLVDAADVTVVEVNDGLPPSPARTLDDAVVDHVTTADHPTPVLETGVVTDVTRAVARNVRTLLPSSPTLQLGVGAVPKAVGAELAGEGPFDVWSGLVGEAARTLDESGDLGQVMGGVAIGETPAFYDWVDGRDDVRLSSPLEVHSPAELDEIDGLVGINSALQVDLQGQVNAEGVDGTTLGGVGGQPGFMQAASADPEGLAVVGIPSRTPGGTSRLVACFDGNPVTTARHAVDAVVTEHGVADLRGLTADEYAAELLGVAHPDDRDALRAAIE